MSSQLNEADVARRATPLLKAFFKEHQSLQGPLLDEAFSGYVKDPRGLIKTDVEPDTFAVDCVGKLLAYGCTDGHRHSLGRLLAVIRDGYLGAKPHPDYVALPRLLDSGCAVPTREEELHYLRNLIAREEELARLYSPLRAVAQSMPMQRVAPLLAPWRGHKDIALLLHQPRPRAADREAEAEPVSRPYDDILAAFSEVKQAALLGQPGAGEEHDASQARRRHRPACA